MSEAKRRKTAHGSAKKVKPAAKEPLEEPPQISPELSTEDSSVTLDAPAKDVADAPEPSDAPKTFKELVRIYSVISLI